MRKYSHFTYEERVKLATMRQSKAPIPQIASSFGKSQSAVRRELKRNKSPSGDYWPDAAQNQSLARKIRGSILDKNTILREFVIDKLISNFWIPEQISGFLKHRQGKLPSISFETIYAWIYQKTQKSQKLWKYLPRHKAKRGLRKTTF